MKKDLAGVILDEEVREIKEDFDLSSHSVVVFYSSSFGSGGGSSIGSAGSFSSMPSYGIGPGSPDYEARRRPDPRGPLSGMSPERKPVFSEPPRIELGVLGNIGTGYSKMLEENKALQDVLERDSPNVPSRLGAPETPDYTQRLSDVVTQGMPSVPSRLGSAGSFNILDQPKLTIYDLPNSGIQLHIHEGPGGTAHFKTYGGKYININSYDAAMADTTLNNLGIRKIKK